MGEDALLSHAVSKARKFVLIIIGILIVYHIIVHLIYISDTCKWLLNSGRYVASQNWQPFGCLIYIYNRTDTRSCLRQQANAFYGNTHHIVIAGDTRMLQLYQYITDHLLSNHSPSRRQYHINDTTLQQDQLYRDDNLSTKLEFLWRPFITDDLFHDIDNWILANENHNQETYHQKEENIPKLLVIGSGLWNLHSHNIKSSENGEKFANILSQYKRNFTRLLPMLDRLASRDTKILWTLQDPIDEGLISTNTTNAQINDFNYATESILNALSFNKNIYLWTSSRAIARGGLLNNIDKDGIHSNELVLDYKAQIMINLICNSINNYEGTCCSDNPQINLGQILLMTLALILILSALFILTRSDYYRLTRANLRWQKLSQKDSSCQFADDANDVVDEFQHPTRANQFVSHQRQPASSYLYSSGLDNDLVLQLAQLGTILIYFFICDQTNFFMKENKYFTLANFLLPITYVFSLGLFFTEHHQPSTNYEADLPSSPALLSRHCGSIMNRFQTYEWKGWMQIVILIYNMSGARQNLRIYMLIRVLLSSYLFLTGYGHFTYFWETRDFSIKRLWRTLFRLNMLALCLCVSMNRPYQNYYFISLVSFWFIVIYIFTSVSPSSAEDKFNTNGALKMFIKFSILLGSITLLYLSEMLIERIFSMELLRPWSQSSQPFSQSVSNTGGSIQSWWSHWSNDRYSVPAGMIFAYVMWLLRVNNIISSGSSQTPYVVSLGNQQQQQQPISDSAKNLPLSKSSPAIIVSLAIVGILGYTIFASTCQDKSACDEVHAYISFIPIVAFIVIRNSTEFLRQRHSVFFAFFGCISLELSLCQYHIWLAAGNHGILVLVPSYPTLNLVLTSVIFITATHKLNNITSHLIPYCAQTDDWRAIIRNIIVFLLVVAPISLQ